MVPISLSTRDTIKCLGNIHNYQLCHNITPIMNDEYKISTVKINAASQWCNFQWTETFLRGWCRLRGCIQLPSIPDITVELSDRDLSESNSSTSIKKEKDTNMRAKCIGLVVILSLLAIAMVAAIALSAYALVYRF